MPRYYYRRSPLGMFLRLMAGTAVLFLGLMAVSWVVTELLPAVLPFLLVGMLAAAVFWVVHKLR